MSPDIGDFVAQRGITRLCHLTPYRNLLQIVTGQGIRSTAALQADYRAEFDQQDLERWDAHPDHICCSIEYPNVWYLNQRKTRATPTQLLYPDWVCVLIDPSVISDPGVRFCERNAASGGGAYLRPGIDGLQDMYAESVVGAYNRVWTRDNKPAAVPTDDQAEVLVPRLIPLHLADRLVVADEGQARRVSSHLDLMPGVDPSDFSIIVCPEFFDRPLSRMLRRGELPVERPWARGEADG